MSESEKDKKHHDIEVKIGSFKLKTKNPFKKKKKYKNKKKHLMTKDKTDLSFECNDQTERLKGINQDDFDNKIVNVEPGQSLFKEKEDEKKDDTVIHIDIVSGPLSIINEVDNFLNKNFNIKGVFKGVHKNAQKHGIKHLAIILSNEKGKCISIDWVNKKNPFRVRTHNNYHTENLNNDAFQFLFATKPYNTLRLNSIIHGNINDLAIKAMSLPFANKKYDPEKQNCHHCTYGLLTSRQFNEDLQLGKHELWHTLQNQIKNTYTKTELNKTLIAMNNKKGNLAVELAKKGYDNLDQYNNNQYLPSEALNDETIKLNKTLKDLGINIDDCNDPLLLNDVLNALTLKGNQ